MNFKELEKVYKSAQGAKNLSQIESELLNEVKMKLKHFDGISEDYQERRNKIVNSIAKTLRQEFGALEKDVEKLLERVRVVSERTVQKDKKAERERGKNAS